MIEPMKKVSVVILDKEKNSALKTLRKIGLLHLEKLEGSSEKLTKFKEFSANAALADSILMEQKAPKKLKKSKKCLISNEEAGKLISEIVAKYDRKKVLMDEINADKNELDRFRLWGDVILEDIDYLKEQGIQLRMFESPLDKYNLIGEKTQTILLNSTNKVARFLLINGGTERPEDFPPEAFEVPLPRCSTKVLEEEIANDTAEIKEIDAFFLENVKNLASIRSFDSALQSDIEFENVYAGMGTEAQGTETDLAWISGYVPTANLEELKKVCKENDWAIAAADPADDDEEVPTKLKNNKFVSLIYPLTDFLGTVPGYHEYDISGWFLFFFTIFFGMIFGDAGYGLLVVVAALILMLKTKISGKKVPSVYGLVILLGISTVIWGTVTCSWFGLGLDKLPDWLKNLSIPPISNVYADETWLPFWVEDKSVAGLTNAQNLQIFCFSIALLQLSVAHIKGMINNRKSLKILGEFGSLLQLIGMYYVVLSMVVNAKIFPLSLVINNIPVGKIAIYCVLGGFILSFIFANYAGNIIKSILESVKNIISVLLGVVNVFSDIVSYIRLWAVGLAGAAISSTVNEMAGPLIGHAVTFIFMILLLVFGHGLNMVLNLLSVIVHGVRLNTLEFSNHLGMSWSGLKYEPFREKISK